MGNYIYTYESIMRWLIKWVYKQYDKAINYTDSEISALNISINSVISKNVNPNIISSFVNSAGFEDIIIGYTDSINIIKHLDYTKRIIMVQTAKGYPEEDIAKFLGCSQQAVNDQKTTIRKQIRRIQNAKL